MAKKKLFDLDCAIHLYENDGLSTSQIAKIFNVHLQTIINRLKAAGTVLRPQGRTASLVDKDQIKKDHEHRLSTKDIGIKYSISTSLVRKKLQECGIRVKPSGGRHRAIGIDKNKLIELYVYKNQTMRSCAKHFGVSSTVIRRHLKNLCVDIRPSTRNTISDISDNEIIDLYWNKKLSIAQVASEIGFSRSLIKRRLNVSGRGTRSLSDADKIRKGTDKILDEQLIYLYDVCGWSCEKISAHFNKSSQFTLKRFIAINKTRRKNTGANNGSWKGGITDIRNAVRSCAASLRWRNNAFTKQKYKSEISGKQVRELNCHHIYPFHVILRSSITKHIPLPDEYRNLAIIGDKRFYDENNGLIISKEEHDKIEDGKFEQAHPWWKIWQTYQDFAIDRSGLTSNDFKLFDSNGQIQPIEYTLKTSTAKEIRDLIRYEHYLGTLPGSKLILVAKRGGTIIGIATFGTGTNRYIKDDTLELTRLCIPFYVVHPFSCEFLNKCCKYIRDNHPQIEKLISFADSSVGHNGGVYRMAGWTKNGKTLPSYAYLNPFTMELRHKSSCRRIKGVNKTEKELAQERGLIRIPLSHKYKYSIAL